MKTICLRKIRISISQDPIKTRLMRPGHRLGAIFQSHKTRLKPPPFRGARMSPLIFQSHKTRLKLQSLNPRRGCFQGFQSHKTRLKLRENSSSRRPMFISISQDPIKTRQEVTFTPQFTLISISQDPIKTCPLTGEVKAVVVFQSHKTRLKHGARRWRCPIASDISISQDPIKTRTPQARPGAPGTFQSHKTRLKLRRVFGAVPCRFYFNLTRPD